MTTRNEIMANMPECIKQAKMWARLGSKRREQDMNMKSEKSMGHFNGWQFGVPVRVYEINPGGIQRCVEARLISEADNYFAITFGNMQIGIRNKANFYYELIPYNCAGYKNRYPVCLTPGESVYCNYSGEMGEMSTFYGVPKQMPIPTTTLIIDGKEIQLSAETVARLKKELGV